MKIVVKHTMEISEEDVEFLKAVKKEGRAKYSDIEFPTFEEFIASEPEYNRKDLESIEKSRETYNQRNFNGTFEKAVKLWDMMFLEKVESAWVTTFILSDLGEYVATTTLSSEVEVNLKTLKAAKKYGI